jgi:hypothetical protein
MIIKIQPSAFVDHITEDGAQLTKLPYPFFVNEDGSIRRQDVWNGKPYRVVGFVKDLAVQQVDLWWGHAFKDPQKMIGMYLVTEDSDGTLGAHSTAIDSYEILTEGVQDGQNRATGSQED